MNCGTGSSQLGSMHDARAKNAAASQFRGGACKIGFGLFPAYSLEIPISSEPKRCLNHHALSVDMSDEFYSVITDMLYSTLNLTSRRDKRWLWLWAMNERQKALQKLRQKKLQRVGDQGEPVDGDSPSSYAPGEDSFGSSDPEDSVQRRRRHLSIADLMNNNPE
ncbi:hypothetical protein TWF788_009882 [Orbilia oligospora]|uniref:Uncharacterized protein n=1 Tax=Orbilia oligospora TaxID=2813651 RepID=A0A7C8U258_ORBOL|nr:hypothetical protein TWF788_009882 [Orbilia oligospora]